MNSKVRRTLFLGMICLQQAGAVTISVDAKAGHKPISPNIYGRNNVLKLSETDAAKMREAGVKILRENGGNNSTKYNWQLDISSHPDWYNNVYDQNWDGKAARIESEFPGTQGFFGFQLLGWAASNKDNNFGDWAYNQAQWWTGVTQNLAGGGVVNPGGGNAATTEGNPLLYLKEWPADSTVGILNHWFGDGGLGLDKNKFLYWSMDNEPDIWHNTHDDIIKDRNPDRYVDNYLQVAPKARAAFPEIKLSGMVAANEWQWYKFGDNASITYKGRYHCWMEYFIRRIGEAQATTGVRLLDVLDFHFYPKLDGTNPTDAKTMANIHRIWFDTSWAYPTKNDKGLYSMNGGWDKTLQKEYVWNRCQEWLDTWLGPNNGVKFGLTESGDLFNTTAQQAAHWYASHLGVFADNEVELFTPWEWYAGQLEVMNLFTKSAKNTRVESVSSEDTLVSAYSSSNDAGDSLTVILVNHSTTTQQSATVSLNNFEPNTVSAETRTLSGLNGETFVSASSNAMKKSTVPVMQKTFTVNLEPLAITAVILTADAQTKVVTAVKSTTGFTYKQQGEMVRIDGYSTEFVKGDIVLLNGRVVKNFAVPAIGGSAEISLEGINGACVIRFENGISRKLIMTNN